jgi:hypothetical protein
MKLNTVLSLASTDLTSSILRQLKKNNGAMTLLDDGAILTLHCEFESCDGQYLCVKIPYPIEHHPKSVARLMIPHGAVLLVAQGDWQKPVGFSPRV